MLTSGACDLTLQDLVQGGIGTQVPQRTRPLGLWALTTRPRQVWTKFGAIFRQFIQFRTPRNSHLDFRGTRQVRKLLCHASQTATIPHFWTRVLSRQINFSSSGGLPFLPRPGDQSGPRSVPERRAITAHLCNGAQAATGLESGATKGHPSGRR